MKRPGEAVPKHLLRSAREQHGWTQEELAEKIGTTGVTISRWESGITFPSRHFRRKLSTLYGKSIRELGLLQEDTPHQILQPFSPPVPRSGSDISFAERDGQLFHFNEPLTALHDFYGRRRERDTLLNRTYRKASTSIIGPRRIGKTWLLNYLRLIAPADLGSRFCLGYLDGTMPSCQTIAGFVAEALDVLNLPTPKNSEGLVALEKGLKLLKANALTPVLCIDEFEGLGNRQEFTLDFFRGLRAMTHIYGLVLVVVSRNPLSSVVGKDVETSGFFNIFEPLMLEAFTLHEAANFINEKSAVAEFKPSEIEALWKYGEESEQEWPPLRLQLVGKMLLEERDSPKDDQLYWQRFEKKLEEIYREIVY